MNIISKSIQIPIDHNNLEATLSIPDEATKIVIFSHGSGSSRLSPRNNFVAKVLNENNLATLLVDLLTKQEDMYYESRFNIDLLTKRLIEITKYIKSNESLKEFKIGYFGASTGAASALNAASELKNEIFAIVSRGGRPDLSLEHLDKVVSPTLLIVGSMDFPVIEMNQAALAKLTCKKGLSIIEGATHLFEELGTLEKVAEISAEWFIRN